MQAIGGVYHFNLTSALQLKSIAMQSVKLGLELCQLHASGSTLMTDGGSAYPGVASDLGMVHILCTNHFENVILKGCTGLGALANSFKADCTSLLYTTMSEVEFQTRFDVAEASMV
ncbi:hypothetical protein H257_14549 [Aphanomyces astaci]|uniref:Uncharacterized protein n=1 Tax=Aphanomyces astaci TaxID=112090 RepID=W4FRV5_APHAT|nr:hypothetical protein H257_14549 [Aphanomyces astaci]ETV69686.1 hypothetical protein H257_14549 [Aphanomyces astaci]|eukprot:XP_009840700.1 hypothetical protein H257_14549 [Aphanomyces astaci]